MANRESKTLPDQKARDLILTDLERNMLVEAAAGTGKTTSMVGRMVALVAQGKCRVERLAAVTFTRKAAAELRSRFQVELEKAYRKAGEREKNKLGEALDYVDRCFIGTIHSFCARLLRERPVEAGVHIDFVELDEIEDGRIRRRAWEEFVAKLYSENDPLLDELDELGLNIGQLENAFMEFADYPDVSDWPTPKVELPDIESARKKLEDYVEHIQKLLPSFPADTGTDKLMDQYRLIAQKVKHSNLTRPSELMAVLEQFKPRSITQKCWPEKAQPLEEKARWNEFTTDVAGPALSAWREYRYEPVIRVLKRARDTYDELRESRGALNFQDLLMKTAALLRNEPRVREYFRGRFTHLLVDEFQDTDPVQAEVMMLLAADEPTETDWRACQPVPGSLFVVGDPKQSIYRFRRADIVTFNQVKKLIEDTGGRIVRLKTNFRTVAQVIKWLNGAFQSIFPGEDTPYSPAHVPLSHGRAEATEGEVAGVKVLKVPHYCSNKRSVTEYEAERLARIIRHTVDSKKKIPRSEKEIENNVPLEATWGDFLIITPQKSNLGVYSRKLDELKIPHQVTGGAAMNEMPELELLHTCLKAVTQPENPVALVAALRGGLFGISDRQLYAFKRAGGKFSYKENVPPSPDFTVFRDAFDRLRRYATWLRNLPPAVAIEKIVADLGLLVRACAAPGGNLRAGALAKAVELMRTQQAAHWSASEVVEYLGRLVRRDESEHENYDAPPARSPEGSIVRVMNLHKAKGLEAPVVFLADPTGATEHPVELHVDRTSRETRGYVAIYSKPHRWGNRTLLAKPPGWEKLEKNEKLFQEAERNRLLYVAATRAGAQLTIAQREKKNGGNPWRTFEKWLGDCPEIVSPDPQRPADVERVEVGDDSVTGAAERIGETWKALSRPTYCVEAAKEISVLKEEVTARGEHGEEWGTVIHLLLQTAMQNPAADLRAVAEAALTEQELDIGLVGIAIETVNSVMSSEIWNRAKSSELRFVEVPFQALVPSDDNKADSVPTVLRGVIDLVFLEPAGWVIVDYKTSDKPGRPLNGLVEKYRPQVRTYAEHWAKSTGKPVHETGLYFTTSGRYIRC